MADITISAGIHRPSFIQAIGQAIGDIFARHRWQRFQLETAPLNERLLSDIGIDRGAVAAASTEHDFMTRNEIFVPRHNLG
jgi:uncharacterized protein YjiS (DUF1127 family)